MGTPDILDLKLLVILDSNDLHDAHLCILVYVWVLLLLDGRYPSLILDGL